MDIQETEPTELEAAVVEFADRSEAHCGTAAGAAFRVAFVLWVRAFKFGVV